MKKLNLRYSDKNYGGIYSLFMQRSLVMLFLKDIIKDDSIIRVGFEVDAWRYVFEKDISKSRIIKTLLKSGVNNLVALEVVDKLNAVRKMVEEVEKKESKK